MMIRFVKQYLNNSNAKLLPNLPSVTQAKKIEKMIKPINFTINNLDTTPYI